MKVTSQLVDRGHRGRITIPVKHLSAIGAPPLTTVKIIQRPNSKFLSIEIFDHKVTDASKAQASVSTVDAHGNIRVSKTSLQGLGDCDTFKVDVNTKKARIEVRTA